jgi:hypothetical protein
MSARTPRTGLNNVINTTFKRNTSFSLATISQDSADSESNTTTSSSQTSRYYNHSYPLTHSSSSSVGKLTRSSSRSPSLPVVVDFFAFDTNGCQGHVLKRYHGIKARMQQDIADLSTQLAASTAQWKIVFGHHPLYTQGIGHAKPSNCLRESTYESKNRNTGKVVELPGYGFEKVLVDGNVDVYLAGHEHVFQVSF